MELEKLTSTVQDQLAQFVQKCEQGETPDETTAQEFHWMCQKLQSCAPDEWYEEAEDFAHLASELYQSIKNQKNQEAILLVDSLSDAYNYLSINF